MKALMQVPIRSNYVAKRRQVNGFQNVWLLSTAVDLKLMATLMCPLGLYISVEDGHGVRIIWMTLLTLKLSSQILNLEPTYEARYRDTNLPECTQNPPEADPWSDIAEGTTHLTYSRVDFVDAKLAGALRSALNLDTEGRAY